MAAAPGILDSIMVHKRTVEVPRLPAVDRAALASLPPTRGFRSALRRPAGQTVRVIAECKKASPSKGIMVPDYDPVLTAYHYLLGGAAAISVLTDEQWFHGHNDHLSAVHAAVALPVLRKDFIVDMRQIAAARLLGADAILLIAAGLEDGEWRDLMGFAQELGLDVLNEVHDADEAARAVHLGCDLIGVNNRNLRTFAIDLDTTIELAVGLVDGSRVTVGESGISSRADCQRLEAVGIDAVLVGEALITHPDPEAALKRLRGAVL